MKTFISNLIRVGFRSILARFIILFVSISLLIQTINFLTYNVYLHYVESELERNYDRSLSNVAVSLNKLFEGIYQSNFLLSLDSSVMKVFSADFSIDELPKYADISQSVRSLARVKYGNASIDSAYILKRDNQLIISNEGTYEESYFYGNVYPMEKYPIEYWQQYSANHDLFQILPPSRITGSNRNQNKTILPVVQSKIAEYASDNLYVIHLNAQYMTDLLRDYRLTPGSMIFIADRNRNMLASTEANFTNDGELQQFLQAALSEPADKFKGTYKGKKMRVIKYTADFFYNKVDMIASIPEEDILDSLKNIENLRYTVEGLTFLLSLILSILFSINLYSPIQKLVRTLRGSQTQEAASHDGNEFHYLDREINRMMSNVHSLNEALSYTLPLANERFFVKMLKNNYPYDDESIGAFLKNSNFTFENDHFMIALIQIHFRKPFYDTFTERFQNEASQKIVTVMKTFMPPQCPGYFLEIDSHLFCLLINLPAQSDRTAYEEYCEEMVGLFKNDEHLLRICAGIGGIRQGYKGMQESYIEAMKALWRVSPFDGKRVYAYTGSDQVPARYLLSKHDENKLFNLLMSGKQEDVYELLKRVIDANIGQGIPDSMIRELYMHFYIVGLQVLKQKDRSLDDSVSKEYVSFIMSGESLSVDEITQYIFSFFENIMFVCSNAQQKFDVTAFKKFIDEHYSEDIHLEYLAQKYNTSAKYMSRLLKNELGIGFQEYLQQLRIGKAKELLRHSDKPIAQIWEEVGFNNRNTFIRAFKNQEGITPSDYRKNIRA